MSGWDAYIDNLIGHSKDKSGFAHIDKACMVGKDGGALWTSAAHASALKVSGEESARICTNLSAPDPAANFGAQGVLVEGLKYQFLRYDLDAKCALGKKKENGAITAQSTKSAVIIAHCPEGGQHGLCNNAVAKVAEYLEGAGY